MDNRTILEQYEKGHIYRQTEDIIVETLAWNRHPVFQGVFLKHLIKGEDTDGRVSCHLVKVEPNCVLDTHAHEEKLEVHEVMEGEGICRIGGRTMDYRPGSVALIPANIEHKVTAGEDGILIRASFSPALL